MNVNDPYFMKQMEFNPDHEITGLSQWSWNKMAAILQKIYSN